MTWNNNRNKQNNNWNRGSGRSGNNGYSRGGNRNNGGYGNRQNNSRGRRSSQQSDNIYLKIGVSYLNETEKGNNPFWSSMMFNFGECVLSDGTELSQDQCVELVKLAIFNNIPVKTSYWEQQDGSLRGVASIDVTDLLQQLGDNYVLEQEEDTTSGRHVAVSKPKTSRKEGQRKADPVGRSPENGQAKGQGRGLKQEEPAFSILSDEEEVLEEDEELF